MFKSLMCSLLWGFSVVGVSCPSSVVDWFGFGRGFVESSIFCTVLLAERRLWRLQFDITAGPL